jgi:Ribbon-helix-helix protein, copG family
MDSDQRQDEKRRREAAQAGVADVEPGGTEVPGRSIKQMLSVRLEAQLLKELRLLAEKRGVSVSDLLREAASSLIEKSHPAPVRMTWTSTGAEQVIISNITASGQVTYGMGAANEPEPTTTFEGSGVGCLAS